MNTKTLSTKLQNQLGFVTLMLAYILLIPGLIQPMLTIKAEAEKAELVELGKRMIEDNQNRSVFMGSVAELLLDQMNTRGSVMVYEKTRSILGTVQDLLNKKYFLVALLIILFSVIVPVAKGFILLLANMKSTNPSISVKMKSLSNFISKWSMADVYAIGILVAFLAANAIKKEAGLLSFDATLRSGFYFFLGYCLLSILSSQLLNNRS